MERKWYKFFFAYWMGKSKLRVNGERYSVMEGKVSSITRNLLFPIQYAKKTSHHFLSISKFLVKNILLSCRNRKKRKIMGIDFNKVLINLDTDTSYVPVLSTVTNLVDLMLKPFFERKEAPLIRIASRSRTKGARLCSFAGCQLLEISLSPRSIAQRKESEPFQKRSKSLQRHRKSKVTTSPRKICISFYVMR